MSDDFKAPPQVHEFIRKDLADIISTHLKIWADDMFGMIKGCLEYSGNQWLAYDDGHLTDYRVEDAESGKILYTDNYMKPLTDQLASRLISRNVKWATKPASSDESDIQRSKGNDKILNYVFEQRNVRRKLKKKAQYITQMGRAYMSAIPNFKSGVFLPDGLTQAGVPTIEVHSPIEVQHQIEFEDSQQSPYMIRWRRFLRSDAERRLERSFSTATRIGGAESPLGIARYLYDTAQDSRFGRELIALPEVWIHPNNGLIDRQFNPKGLVILFDPDRNEAIEISEWQYPFSGVRDNKEIEEAHYPFHDCPFCVVTGTARVLGATQLLSEKQRDLNRVETMIRWHVNISASPILHDPDGGVSEEDRVIEAGAIWKWNWRDGQPPPGFLQPPNLNAEVVNLPAQIKNDMREALMVREVSLASGEGADSGVMLAQMQATDNANFSQLFIDDDDQNANVCRDVLKEVSAYMPPSFKLEILGHKSGGSQLEVIKTQTIDPMTDVVAVSKPYETPITKESRLIQRVTQGLMSRDDFILEMDGRDPNESKTIDIEKALKENEWLQAGQDIEPPGVADNDDVHAEQHGVWIRSVEFLRETLKVRQRAEAHWQMHKDRLNQAAMQTQPMDATQQRSPSPPEKRPTLDTLTRTVIKGQSNAARGIQGPTAPTPVQ